VIVRFCRDPRSGLSQISWRTSVAHHPTEDTAPSAAPSAPSAPSAGVAELSRYLDQGGAASGAAGRRQRRPLPRKARPARAGPKASSPLTVRLIRHASRILHAVAVTGYLAPGIALEPSQITMSSTKPIPHAGCHQKPPATSPSTTTAMPRVARRLRIALPAVMAASPLKVRLLATRSRCPGSALVVPVGGGLHPARKYQPSTAAVKGFKIL
jgi:hypothetical protein